MPVLYAKGAMRVIYWLENDLCSALFFKYENGLFIKNVYIKLVTKSALPIPNKRPITLLGKETFSFLPKIKFAPTASNLNAKSTSRNMDKNEIASGFVPAHLV